MYVIPNKRGSGIASLILTELEQWAKDLAFKNCLLETGNKQPEAVAFFIQKTSIKLFLILDNIKMY